ncbi:hypothetical protein EW146_g9420 [Bondarzewia mesenterica]|uniref:Uncharacterized protein n=1 Tax=Bondarzewia mesenterica TaxID=1095465 RepID=A0A4S4L8F0_9AGAM|nr:hypothetical protein EW146_g9420 [Bondarzewia mesenterica]
MPPGSGLLKLGGIAIRLEALQVQKMSDGTASIYFSSTLSGSYYYYSPSGAVSSKHGRRALSVSSRRPSRVSNRTWFTTVAS